MSTIPASDIVQVLPGTISAGGNGLALNGLMITNSYRVPINSVMSFASSSTVSAYFGALSPETAKAVIYFNGYTNSTQRPGAMLIAQYPQTNVAAWLQSGPVSGLTVAQLQALTGSLTIVTDSFPRTAAALNLSAATSYSSAAAIIQTALDAILPTEATFTGSVAAGAASFTGTISGDVLTVTSVASGTLQPGALLAGGSVLANTLILLQETGVTGGIGTYAVSAFQAVASAAMTASYGVLTVTAVATGTISIGQALSTGGAVYSFGTGTGLTGTYYISAPGVVASGPITATAVALFVTYDSLTGSFLVTSGVLGAASNIAFATGTLAASLNMTAATGAVISQGANAQTPSQFMSGIILNTQNWASFFLTFDPDGGLGNAQKLAFSAWANAQNYRYVYLAWDADISPTVSNTATTSLGALVAAASMSGTSLIYDPNNTGVAAFISGAIASVNFQAINGRITFAFRNQTGLGATVSDRQVSANLLANSYNFLGAYATANQQFTMYYNGSVSGPFQWLDSFINQIWMNSQFQLALILLLQNIGNIPYNKQGYALIEASLLTTINQAFMFGAIRSGVPMSSAQIAQVNNSAGYKIDNILSSRGWYLQIQDATPQVRQARTSPPCFFWYLDGGSVQKLTLNSIELQ